MIDVVPFVVIHLGNARAKALFSVPPTVVQKVLLHPIVCRGSHFSLSPYKVAGIFTVAVEYESCNAKETALTLALRLAGRVNEYTPPKSGLQEIKELRQRRQHPQLCLKSISRQPKVAVKGDDKYNTLDTSIMCPPPSLKGSSREEETSPEKNRRNRVAEKPRGIATSVLSKAASKRQQLRIRTSPTRAYVSTRRSTGEKTIKICSSSNTLETDISEAFSLVAAETCKDEKRGGTRKPQSSSVLSLESRAEMMEIIQKAEAYQIPPAPKSSSIKEWQQMPQLKATPISPGSPQPRGEIFQIPPMMKSTEKAKAPSTQIRPTFLSHSEQQELSSEAHDAHRQSMVDSPQSSIPSLTVVSSSSFSTRNTGDIKGLVASQSPVENFNSPKSGREENIEKHEQRLDLKPKAI